MQANRASAATVESRCRSDDFYTTFSVADTFIAHLFLRFEFGQHSVRWSRLHLRLICAVQAAAPRGYKNEWSLWESRFV
jgi:hypothetical protein